MPNGIPTQWYAEPPQMLVGPDGVYGRALAQVLGATGFTTEMLRRGPEPLQNGSFPNVFDSVQRVLLCVEERTSTAEVIWQHDRLRHWLELLTGAAEYHEVGFVFIAGEHDAQPLDALLRVELGLGSDQEASGITLWRKTESLASLLSALNAVGKRDLQTLRTFRAGQLQRQVLIQLKAAILTGNTNQIHHSAKDVARVFQHDQLSLDNFCNPPCHKNGNAWRRWISRVVTEGVTQELGTEGNDLVPNLNF
jgi:hypothetical protein